MLKSQTKAIGRAVSIALILTVGRIILSVALQSPYLATSVFITHLIIGIGCLIASWRYNLLSPFFAWIAGYLFFWATLATVNTGVTIAALNRSIPTLIILLLIIPIPSIFSSTIGSIIGKLLRRVKK